MAPPSRDLGRGGWSHPDTWVRVADLLEAGRHADHVLPVWERMERIAGHFGTGLEELSAGLGELVALDEELLYSSHFVTHVGEELRQSRLALGHARGAVRGLMQVLETWRGLFAICQDRRESIMIACLARPCQQPGVQTFRPWSVADIALLYFRRDRLRHEERSTWQKKVKRALAKREAWAPAT